MHTKIRFIIETISSQRDTNGNRYHAARITSTATGDQLFIANVGGPSSVLALVTNAMGSAIGRNSIPLYDYCYCIESEIPKRQWQALTRKESLYEHQVTSEMILALEMPS